MEVFGVVYLIWCKINGMRYVGQTIQPLKKRFNNHASSKKCSIGKAICKYGKENFYYGVIVTCYSRAELDEKEKFFIAVLRTKEPYGYNRTDGGEGFSGYKRTPEEIAKISASQKGKHHTAKTCASISATLSGVPKSPEHCAAIAAGLKGKFIGEKNHRFGKHHTKIVCHTISAKQRGDSPFKNLLNEIDAQSLTYAKLAKLMGFKSMSNISDKMHGRKYFTTRDKIKLEEIFGKSIEYLLQHENNTEIVEPVGRKKLPPEHYKKLSEKTRNDSQFKNLISEIDTHNLTYAALAKLMDLSKSAVSERMRSIRDFTDADKIKLVEIFCKPIEYLLECTAG